MISVTADSLRPGGCSGSICPNTDLLRDLTSDVLIDGSERRQFWAAKEVRQYIQNKHVCTEDKCEICDCDCEYDCRSAQTETVKKQKFVFNKVYKGLNLDSD